MLLAWVKLFLQFLCFLRFGTADNDSTSSSGHYRDWINDFQTVHHLAGWYIYNGNRFSFDFYIKTINEYGEKNVLATFDDQDHAVFDVIGTSSDDQTVTFTLVNMYMANSRFQTDMQFEMSGTITTIATSLTYQGTVTKPPQFGAFFMSVYAETDTGSANPEQSQSRTLLIVLIPTSVGLIMFTVTIIIICWAFRKGYFRNIPKSYQFFQNQPVTYSSETDKVHI